MRRVVGVGAVVLGAAGAVACATVIGVGWWVAADAVQGTVTQDGRTALRLKNGLTTPVSRTYLPAVRERRWPPA